MGACGLTADAGYGALRTALLQNAMTVAGIVTLVQMFSIGPIGGKVPIVMGTSSGFLGVFKSVTAVLGQGALTYGAILGATIVGGLFEGVLGVCLKPLRKFFPCCGDRNSSFIDRTFPDQCWCQLLWRRIFCG